MTQDETTTVTAEEVVTTPEVVAEEVTETTEAPAAPAEETVAPVEEVQA